MKGAKVRVEPKIIHTADVDAFANGYTSTTMLLKWQSQHVILTLTVPIATFFLKSKVLPNTDWEI